MYSKCEKCGQYSPRGWRMRIEKTKYPSLNVWVHTYNYTKEGFRKTLKRYIKEIKNTFWLGESNGEEDS